MFRFAAILPTVVLFALASIAARSWAGGRDHLTSPWPGYDAYYDEGYEFSPGDLDDDSDLPVYVADITVRKFQATAANSDRALASVDGNIGGDPGGDCCQTCERGGGWQFEVQFHFMRPHVKENSGGVVKYSEQYEPSPRILLGYENDTGQGGRLRYWNFDHRLPDVSNAAGGTRFAWNVIDLEVTQKLRFRTSDVTLSGGCRMASTELSDVATSSADFVGLTGAVDVETRIYCNPCGHAWSWVYGGRLSLLGGDWDTGGSNFVGTALRDDNVLVTELYTGVELKRHQRGFDVEGRAVFEIQNWHSNHFAAVSGTDSIGFIGPGLHFGITF